MFPEMFSQTGGIVDTVFLKNYNNLMKNMRNKALKKCSGSQFRNKVGVLFVFTVTSTEIHKLQIITELREYLHLAQC